MEYFIDFAAWQKEERWFSNRVGIIYLNRGECPYTIKGLSNWFGATRDIVRKRIEILAKPYTNHTPEPHQSHTKNSDFMENSHTKPHPFCHIKSHTNYSIATILNYDKYQGGFDQEPPEETHQEPHENPQQSHTRATRNKNNNNIKNKKELEKEYPWIDVERWISFRKMRIKIRKPMTAKAEEMGIKKLKGFIDDGYDQAELLDTAESKCWLEVYPPKKANSEADEWIKQFSQRQ